MTDFTPQAWLCKQCNERVDPTMEICWQCGHDRNGVAHPTLFIDPVPVDLTRCGQCKYPLKGNPDATHCPECGEPVPWVDCMDCGVRTSRLEMVAGCPACKAVATGKSFIPEVERKKYPACELCQYDLTGSTESESCPECGALIDRGRYETYFPDESDETVESGNARVTSPIWIVLLLIWLPFGAALFYIGEILSRDGLEELVFFVVVTWSVILIVVVTQVFSLMNRK